MTKIDTYKILFDKLENEKFYTLESLSEEIGVEKAEVHKAFVELCKLPGWSIRPSNCTPYWSGFRQAGGIKYPRTNRGRTKGEPYDHDMAEPDWNRTKYVVRRPEE
jgi:hypothetical protein